MTNIWQQATSARLLWSDPKSGIRIQDFSKVSSWIWICAFAILVGCLTWVMLDTWAPAIWIWPVAAYSVVGCLTITRINPMWLPTLTSITAMLMVGYASALGSYFATLSAPSAHYWSMGFLGAAALAAWAYGVMLKAHWTVPEVATLTLTGLVVPPLAFGLSWVVPLCLGAVGALGLRMGGWWANKHSLEIIEDRTASKQTNRDLTGQLFEQAIENTILKARHNDLQRQVEAKQREHRKRMALGRLEEEVVGNHAKQHQQLMRKIRATLSSLQGVEDEMGLVQESILDPKTRGDAQFLMRHLGIAATELNRITDQGERWFVDDDVIDLEVMLNRALEAVAEIHPAVEISTTTDIDTYRTFRWGGGAASFAYCLVILSRHLVEQGATRLWTRCYYDAALYLEIEGDAPLGRDVLAAFDPEHIRKARSPGWGVEWLPIDLQRVWHYADANGAVIRHGTPRYEMDHPHMDDEHWSDNTILQVRIMPRLIPDHPAAQHPKQRRLNPYVPIGSHRKGDLH